MISPVKLITRIILTFVLPVITTVITALLIAVVISFVASTMGYDFEQQYQAILKDGSVFIIPGIICIIGTIMYWVTFDEEY